MFLENLMFRFAECGFRRESFTTRRRIYKMSPQRHLYKHSFEGRCLRRRRKIECAAGA